MEIIKAKNYQDLSKKAARLIASQVRLVPLSVLGLATGSTPTGMYAELIRMYREEDLDFQFVTTFNLDEYYSLSPEHPQSYNHFMREYLFDHININPANTYMPDGLATDLPSFCRQYDELLENYGGSDIQILGIGQDGHIAFNEPSHVFTAETHLVNLTEDTIQANSRFFNSIDEVPKQAVTMGMKSILSAELIILLAEGINKAWAIRQMIKGAVDPQLPASVLQLHPNVIVIADEDALSQLTV